MPRAFAFFRTNIGFSGRTSILRLQEASVAAFVVGAGAWAATGIAAMQAAIPRVFSPDQT
jgi:hypothetical protein